MLKTAQEEILEAPAAACMMSEPTLARAKCAVDNFVAWLNQFGEVSYDFQTFYASDLPRSAKALYYRKPVLGALAVSPMIFCEAFVPSARKLFSSPQRFPIADAHYSMGFSLLYRMLGDTTYYRTAVHFLQMLLSTACQGYSGYSWGYPFNWETINGTIRKGTPLITTLPYAYEAFAQVYEIDHDQERLRVMRSIAEHALHDYRDYETSDNAATCAYTPDRNDRGCVINASAYRAFLLTRAGADFSDERYKTTAARNLNFVLDCQNCDGSWYYAADGRREFIDHFHTCFVLKALVKIEQITGGARLSEAIRAGVNYYSSRLFDENDLPIPFAKAPRLTVYRRELYDYAECINLATLLKGRFPKLEGVLSRVLGDLLDRWQKPDGSFRSRQLLLGWDNVPMHRWAQAQLFRSVCLFLFTEAEESRARPGQKGKER